MSRINAVIAVVLTVIEWLFFAFLGALFITASDDMIGYTLYLLTQISAATMAYIIHINLKGRID